MYHIHARVSLLRLVIVSYRCVSMKGRFSIYRQQKTML